jgi:hypothetical protein
MVTLAFVAVQVLGVRSTMFSSVPGGYSNNTGMGANEIAVVAARDHLRSGVPLLIRIIAPAVRPSGARATTLQSPALLGETTFWLTVQTEVDSEPSLVPAGPVMARRKSPSENSLCAGGLSIVNGSRVVVAIGWVVVVIGWVVVIISWDVVVAPTAVVARGAAEAVVPAPPPVVEDLVEAAAPVTAAAAVPDTCSVEVGFAPVDVGDSPTEVLIGLGTLETGEVEVGPDPTLVRSFSEPQLSTSTESRAVQIRKRWLVIFSERALT